MPRKQTLRGTSRVPGLLDLPLPSAAARSQQEKLRWGTRRQFETVAVPPHEVIASIVVLSQPSTRFATSACNKRVMRAIIKTALSNQNHKMRRAKLPARSSMVTKEAEHTTTEPINVWGVLYNRDLGKPPQEVPLLPLQRGYQMKLQPCATLWEQ